LYTAKMRAEEGFALQTMFLRFQSMGYLSKKEYRLCFVWRNQFKHKSL